MPSLRPDQLICFIIGIGVCLILPGPLTFPVQSQTITPPPIFDQGTPIPLKNTGIPLPELSAQGVIVFEPQSGSLLYEKNADQSFPLASLTKLMTALIAVETYDLQETVTITTEPSVEGSRMNLVSGEKIAVENLLAGLLIHSGNDAAEALANHYPTGKSGFVKAMNDTAQRFSLQHTAFSNPSGLDDQNQFSSPHDIAILTKALLLKPEIITLMGKSVTQVTSQDGTITHVLNTTNDLLGKVDGLTAGKTGSTLLAGECLMTVVNRSGRVIVTVVMGSTDRFNDTQLLIDWAYQNYIWTFPEFVDE